MLVPALFGVVVGCLVGLVPGIHTNLVAIVVGSFVDGVFGAVFLVAVAVSRSVVDALSTVFLGCSDDIMALSPAHRLLKKGYGRSAVLFLVGGALFGAIAALCLAPLLIVIFPRVISVIRPILFWLLLALIVILLFRERKWYVAVFIFLLSGALGLVVLSSIREPLFPLLSGLFGASSMLLSLKESSVIPVQKDVIRPLKKFKWCSSIVLGVFAGSFVSLFPGLGPSQAAALVQIRKIRAPSYLVLLGALGTVDVVVSLITFFAMGAARNGAVVIIERLLGSFSAEFLVALLVVAMLALGCSALFSLLAVEWYVLLLDWVEYQWLSCFVLAVLLVLSFILSGLLGVLVFITAIAVGVLAPLLGVSRSHAMGCLLLPTLFLLW